MLARSMQTWPRRARATGLASRWHGVARGLPQQRAMASAPGATEGMPEDWRLGVDAADSSTTGGSSSGSTPAFLAYKYQTPISLLEICNPLSPGWRVKPTFWLRALVAPECWHGYGLEFEEQRVGHEKGWPTAEAFAMPRRLSTVHEHARAKHDASGNPTKEFSGLQGFVNKALGVSDVEAIEKPHPAITAAKLQPGAMVSVDLSSPAVRAQFAASDTTQFMDIQLRCVVIGPSDGDSYESGVPEKRRSTRLGWRSIRFRSTHLHVRC